MYWQSELVIYRPNIEPHIFPVYLNFLHFERSKGYVLIWYCFFPVINRKNVEKVLQFLHKQVPPNITEKRWNFRSCSSIISMFIFVFHNSSSKNCLNFLKFSHNNRMRKLEMRYKCRTVSIIFGLNIEFRIDWIFVKVTLQIGTHIIITIIYYGTGVRLCN